MNQTKYFLTLLTIISIIIFLGMITLLILAIIIKLWFAVIGLSIMIIVDLLFIYGIYFLEDKEE